MSIVWRLKPISGPSVSWTLGVAPAGAAGDTPTA
jgi:hypothetical protein